MKCPCGCALIIPRHDSRDTAKSAMVLWKRLEPALWRFYQKRRAKLQPAAAEVKAA